MVCARLSDEVEGFGIVESRGTREIEETCGFLVSDKTLMVGTPILRLAWRPRSNRLFARFVIR